VTPRVVVGVGRSERLSTREKYEGNRQMSVHLFFNAATARLRRNDGQGLAEYALILALIAIVAVLALVFLGSQISGILSTIAENI